VSARVAWLLILLAVAGCSGDAVKRTSYETLQSMRQQECQKDLTVECPQRERYEDYQRQREQAVVPR